MDLVDAKPPSWRSLDGKSRARQSMCRLQEKFSARDCSTRVADMSMIFPCAQKLCAIAKIASDERQLRHSRYLCKSTASREVLLV
jgi:hypothetical protein